MKPIRKTLFSVPTLPISSVIMARISMYLSTDYTNKIDNIRIELSNLLRSTNVIYNRLDYGSYDIIDWEYFLGRR